MGYLHVIQIFRMLLETPTPKNQGDPPPGSVASLWATSHGASAGGQHGALAEGLGGTGTDLWRTSLCEGQFQLRLREKGPLRKPLER